MALKGRQVAVLILGVMLAGAVAIYATTKGCGYTPNGTCLVPGVSKPWDIGSDTRLLWFTIAAVVFIVAAILALSPWARGTDTKG